MVARISTMSKAALLFTSLFLVWIIDTTANGLFDFEETLQVEDVLPYVEIKKGSHLDEDGKEASQKQVPILIFFSMEHCPYCREVEEDFLKPMLRNSEYENKVLIRKIKIESDDMVRDFSGRERDPGEFSEEYNVSMVPTVVLVDSQGKKIAPAIVGILNSHYYSGELDDAIDASLLKLRSISKR